MRNKQSGTVGTTDPSSPSFAPAQPINSDSDDDSKISPEKFARSVLQDCNVIKKTPAFNA